MPRTIIENTVVAYLDNEDSPDISNPIHSTEVAKAYGFTGPLVGGVTVWGWATDTILAALGEDWLADGWAEYSFRLPTFPGDTLTIRAELDAESPSGSWTVQMINQSDEVCVAGKVGLGKAVWSHELIRPESMHPTEESQVKGSLTLENAKIGKDWAAMKSDFSEESSREFMTQKQRTGNPSLSTKTRSLILHGRQGGQRNYFGTTLTFQVPCIPEATCNTTAKFPSVPRLPEART